MNKLLCKKGFTLAETLIVLLVIGIIAALVIPIAITKYQKLQTETKLKKVYSALENAIELAKIDHGDPINWDWSEGFTQWGRPLNWTNLYIKPYLNVVTDYYDTVKRWNWRCPPYRYCYYAKTMNGNQQEAFFDLLLADGTGIEIWGGQYDLQRGHKPYVRIIFDINGSNPPNIFGKDIFCVYFFAEQFFITSTNRKRVDAIANCQNNWLSLDCLDLIKDNGWKIPDDYPW